MHLPQWHLADIAIASGIFPPTRAELITSFYILSTFLFAALMALFYHLFAAKLPTINISFPVGVGRAMVLNLQDFIATADGNTLRQLFHKSESDLLGYRNRWKRRQAPPQQKQQQQHPRVLRRCLTSIGRFTIRSQTDLNPSNIAFFLALGNRQGEKAMDTENLEALWRRRVMDKHERFRSRLCQEDDRFFEVRENITCLFMNSIKSSLFKLWMLLKKGHHKHMISAPNFLFESCTCGFFIHTIHQILV